MSPFDFDQEYAAIFAYKVLKEYPIQLIGQGLSFEGLFMGPLYFYFLVPFYALTNLHPIGGAIGSVLLGLITIFVYFFVIRNLFGTVAGLIAAFLRGILFSFINTDWSVAPAFSADLMVVLTWWCFYKLWHGDVKFLPFLALLFGLYPSFHPILFPFYLVFIILLFLRGNYFIKNTKLPDFRTIIFSILLFIIPLIPLILFEYFHNFLEIKHLFEFKPAAGTGILEFNNYYHYFETIFISSFGFFGNNLKILYFLTFFVYTIFIFLNMKKVSFFKDSFHKTMLFITFLSFIIYYIRFPLQVPEYYFLALGTLIIIYLSCVLSLLTRYKYSKILLFLILFEISCVSFNALNKRWNAKLDPIYLYHKEKIVQEILKRQPEGDEFYVSYITNLGGQTGYEYLFKYHNKVPQTREAKPPIYTIVSPVNLSTQSVGVRFGNVGLILPR